MKYKIDAAKLWEAIDKKVKEEKITKVDVLNYLMISSPTTFDRIRNGSVPTTYALVNIIAWLDADMRDFIIEVKL